MGFVEKNTVPAGASRTSNMYANLYDAVKQIANGEQEAWTEKYEDKATAVKAKLAGKRFAKKNDLKVSIFTTECDLWIKAE